MIVLFVKNVDVNERDHKKLASARAERAINYWGPHLFPLIDSAELLIKGIRNIRNEMNVPPSKKAGIFIITEEPEIFELMVLLMF